jgi:hypothetical protein
MADTYTSTLGAILMAIGGDNNTWGTNLNNSVIQVLEDAIANTLTTTASAGALGPSNILDLSASPPPAGPSAARHAALAFAGAITANQTVKVPNLTKSWLVKNATSGAFSVSMQTPSGTPQTIPQGGWQIVQCDGANGIIVWPFNTSQVLMGGASAGFPAYSFSAEPLSGWYRAGTQDLRLSINGSDVLQVTGTGAASPSVFNILGPETLQLAGASVGTFTTGDVKLTFKTVADPGWLMMDDGTLGSASSNATHTGTQYQALFSVIWAMPAAGLTIYTSGGVPTTFGASAAADFAANKRLSLPTALGRALAVAGAGAGLTSRQLGQFLGEESHTLVQNELPNVVPAFSGTAKSLVAVLTAWWNNLGQIPTGGTGTAIHALQNTSSGSAGSATFNLGGTLDSGSGLNMVYDLGGPDQMNNQIKPEGTISSINGNVATVSHNNMQPTTFLNVMIKL